ncbi:Putative 3'(2'),5'-bisphosphate nucleotidase [Candidatus Phycorickettsia trachydisci]|uniref:3'(2'),5'-bisphosphate nucleotidase n=1 Tax=Candidatus Phycorickettsia trachydisci TaxID=2115978 RepID=A0A2P1P6W1_9RICK|nr:3'(2'),5'-bisphosphate nucleotidase CysQ [Candidatus Phycorickettsia trachydisci]AVP87009.1 Putative 3'(2'),5'-bisphosphate nucleotidase [Candidatus Phycorickettsia trachydisci]
MVLDFEAIISLLEEGGQIATSMQHNLEVKRKSDGSFVTNADIKVSDFITENLSKITPTIPVISEEDHSIHFVGKKFWLLDPIDGTKHYVKGKDNYAINLALVDKHVPIIGFVYHPATKTLFFNNEDKVKKIVNGKESIIQPVEGKLKILMPDNQKNSAKIYERPDLFAQVPPSSNANRLAMVINGDIDVYYVSKMLMEWDTAAAHSILQQIGGDIMDKQGNTLVYGKPLFGNSDLIVCSKRAMDNKEMILRFA